MVFYCTTIGYHVELNAISGGRSIRLMSKKNRRLVLTKSYAVGDPSGVLPPIVLLLSLAMIYAHLLFIARKEI